MGENKLKYIIHGILSIRGLFTIGYVGLILTPSDLFVEVSHFHVDDVKVGEYAYIDSIRKSKINLGGTVIEEIDMVIPGKVTSGVLSKDVTEVVYSNQRVVFTEKSVKHVRRKIDYIHTHTGDYELYLRITHDLNFMGIHKVIVLHDTYKVK